MKENYIKAVLDKIEEGVEPERVLSGLQDVLAKKGHTKLYSSILRGVSKVLETKKSGTALVKVAKEGHYELHKDLIDKTIASLAGNAKPAVEVDDTLIGGFVVEASHKRIDNSYKTKLVSLYRSLTR